MSSRARRYLDLLEEKKAVAQLLDEGDRERQLGALMHDLWLEMGVDEREAVFKAVTE